MAKRKAAWRPAEAHEKEMVDLIKDMSRDRQVWQTWQDMIAAMACSISNAIDRTKGHLEEREKEYAGCIDRLGGVGKPARALAVVVEALERDPEQDFLGKIYMGLNLGNHWTGQFFTPYGVCRLMAQISVGDADRQIEGQGYISVCDPACGAGATLIAAANTMKGSKYGFQDHVLFVGQDVDRVVAQMCYIQLSLLGCAGYICVGNTITHPMTGHVLFPQEGEGQELWYMPMLQSDTWRWRRAFKSLEDMCGTMTVENTTERESCLEFFRSDGKEKEMKDVNMECPEVRERLERDAKVRHFTADQKTDNGYGEDWGAVVQAYLREAYKAERKLKEITVSGILYKILVRPDDTVFYDADGATLFDVENARLDSEYGEVMQRQGTADTGCPDKAQPGEGGKRGLGCPGGISGECSPGEKAADPVQGPSIEGLDAVDIKEQAKKKLEGELKRAGEGTDAGQVIKYLIRRCAEDRGLSEDVMQEHKTWEKCHVYIYGRAKAQIPRDREPVQGVIGVHVCDETAYEWAEDYYHKDDKAEEEEKARKEAERKEKLKKEAEERAARAKNRPAKAAPAPGKKKEKPKGKGQTRPKKNSKDMEGQLDLFSMMGI